MYHHSPSCPTKLILKGTPEELASLVARKVVLIARQCAGIPIDCETATAEECKQESPLARSLVLLLVYSGNENKNTNSKEVLAVGTSRAMIKTVASMARKGSNSTRTIRSDLMGRSAVEEGMIDGWLNFYWTSIELPLQMVSGFESTPGNATHRAAAEKDLITALKKVEEHLGKQESSRRKEYIDHTCYMVATSNNPSFTLADLSLAVTIHFMLEKNILVSIMNSKENPHLCSWYQSMKAELIFIDSREG